jgi:hypothetical protein
MKTSFFEKNRENSKKNRKNGSKPELSAALPNPQNSDTFKTRGSE